MFDGVHTDPRISERLRQDMMPVSPRPTPPHPIAPKPEPVMVKPRPAPQPESPAPPPVEEFVPQVETAPFVGRSEPLKMTYLSWMSIILIVPSVIFWLLSLLYVVGLDAPLRAIVTTVPFALIVSLNTLMPLATISLGLLFILKTAAGESGRLTAKLALILAGLCLLALIFWLVSEAM